MPNLANKTLQNCHRMIHQLKKNNNNIMTFIKVEFLGWQWLNQNMIWNEAYPLMNTFVHSWFSFFSLFYFEPLYQRLNCYTLKIAIYILDRIISSIRIKKLKVPHKYQGNRIRQLTDMKIYLICHCRHVKYRNSPVRKRWSTQQW